MTNHAYKTAQAAVGGFCIAAAIINFAVFEWVNYIVGCVVLVAGIWDLYMASR